MAYHLLIVEDDEYLIEAYQANFKTQGFQVEIARDGEEALTKLKTKKYDLVLLDLVMPKKGGLETLKEVKSNPAISDIPIVIASNIDQKKVVDEALSLGARDYFIKSDISIDALIEKCHKILNVTS